ncbi:exodeoxyribonuclease V subunit gamma [uncultured Salegentibacter sp.]|uniref:exodeoxyribonuclease V subunit gamma n=1 Tax=uncultured Salegentibacter sp. TaxID=259320 RepID=UPI00259385DB|nr:exodeoxyribonuclease V subunit gamma [uncultured Salegentibacter sp.]
METTVEMPRSENERTSIKLYTASSNTKLAKELAGQIKKDFKNLVFQPVHIVTPNKAQHNWLKEQLARELGFIANLEQHNLRSFFSGLFQELFPEDKERSRTGHLVWKLFSELAKESFRQKFPKIAEYCGEDEIKRLALAHKLSGLFQEYEQYRPELIQEWIKTGGDSQEEEDDWQAYLYVAAGFGENFVPPDQFEMQLGKNSKTLESYKSLYIFGEVDFTPLQLQYLKILVNQPNFRVYIYRANLEIKTKANPLAQNWGALAELTKKQLQELTDLPENGIHFDTPKNDLNRIQQSILKDSESCTLEKDDSLLIYNSFTKVREVEALYNYLVKTVDEANKKGEKIGARDIAVYVPNLDPYIPAIKTVFDSAPYKFPYTLVSKGFSREENFWTALEQVLSFEEEDFTAPKVFNLLEMQPIQKSFGFSDLDLLRKAFIDANIRRKYEGDEELETNTVSFRNGLERLMYGFCLGDENPVEIEGKKIWPVDIAEGSAAQDLFRLHHLVELLHELVEKKKKKQSAAEWHKELMRIADDFLQPEERQEERLSNLMENLIALETSEEKVEFRTFFHRLKDHLQNQDVQQLTGKGGIVFSGLYPGVSMPKKVVAFLGLNFKEFPRKSQELSFDLLSENYKPSSRVEDRGAFLQAFLNTEEKVLLSYVGQNVKDNSEIPASSIFSEIQDYAEKKGNKFKEVKHALHAYNSKYFKENEEDYFTYLIGKERKLGFEKKEPAPAEVEEKVPLFRLVSFLKDPFKHHYNKALGIYYKDTGNLPDWEPFDLGPLEKWKVKDLILEQMLISSFDLEEHRIKMLQEGSLPLKIVGEKALEEGQRKVDLLLAKVRELSSAPIDEIEFDLDLITKSNRHFTLKCKIPVLGQEGLFLSASKKKKKYELAAFVQYLALVAGGNYSTFHYVALNKDEDQSVCISYTGLYNPEEAKNHLKSLLEFYVENHTRLIPFSPEFEFTIGQLDKCKDTEEKREVEQLGELIDEKFSDGWNFYPSEYLRIEYAGGFFDEEKNLLELKHIYKSIMGLVEEAGKTKR